MKDTDSNAGYDQLVDVVGFEGLYKVNKQGQVYNNRGRLMTLSSGKDTSYKTVRLTDAGGKAVTKPMTVLMAEAFLPDRKKYARRKVANNDYSIDNIYWSDYQYNTRKPHNKPEYLIEILKYCLDQMLAGNKDILKGGDQAVNIEIVKVMIADTEEILK
jgi:hypothetical protein